MAAAAFSRFLNYAVLLLIAICILSCSKKNQLPNSAAVLKDLNANPYQESISQRNYVFDYLGTEYVIHPVAEYEIAGMVVTHNDIGALSDIYHTSSSVDIRDLCLIWGSNLDSDEFHKVTFWSEPWSCQFQYGPEVHDFNHSELSNTHLLANSDGVRKAIGKINIGDQVLLRGKLINYAPACCSEQLRISSLIRTDTGNGACEVMMVESAEILKAANTGWHQIFHLSKLTLYAALMIKAVLFFSLPPSFRN